MSSCPVWIADIFNDLACCNRLANGVAAGTVPVKIGISLCGHRIDQFSCDVFIVGIDAATGETQDRWHDAGDRFDQRGIICDI